MSYFEDVYLKRMNLHGKTQQERVQYRKEKEFDELFLRKTQWQANIYQINDELNTSHKETNSRGKTTKVYDYPQLNGDLNTMRGLIIAYYHKYVMPNLFKYEFIK